MEKLRRDELQAKLDEIHRKGVRFFSEASDALGTADYLKEDVFAFIKDRDELWDSLPELLKNKASTLIQEIIGIAPLIAESARMTPYLTEADQIDLGHAVKGIRSALRLCRYKYWDAGVIHDEDRVLGVKPPGQSDSDGIYPDAAVRVFEDCFRRIIAIFELVSPSTFKNAEHTIEMRGQLSSGFQPDTAFIMMWINPKHPELEDVYNIVRRCFKDFGITAERADDIEHEGLITEKIIDKIKSSEFLFADLTGARPSVYYEVGFAHAVRKRVILYRKKETELHFDLAGYNCPEYKNLSDLEDKLRKRLFSMTGRSISK